MSYIPRALTPRILQPSGPPVIVVEGARAVGKTSLMTQEIAPAYATQMFSLGDKATYEKANDDVGRWLRSLPRPCIIDEAQLISDLPLALKLVVDEHGPGTQFILTGSASINRTGLGGADPLTRRARRLTLHPLTLWEIHGVPGNFVDALFDSEFDERHEASWSDATLHNVLERGGFPGYTSLSRKSSSGIRDDVWEDIRSTLGDRILPDALFDATTALNILRAFLVNPGRRFNASKLQELVDLDRRTITRYVDIFERLFLTYYLPNLGTRPDSRGIGRAKVHPVDVALSHAALNRDRTDWSERREVLGQLVESFIAQQVRAHASISEVSAEVFFWAQSKPTDREVDVVLVGSDGRRVGIECKLASKIRNSDLAGLRAMDEKLPLHRGFIIHNGSHVTRLGDKYWALPLAALETSEFFRQPKPTDRSTSLANTSVLQHHDASSLPSAAKVMVCFFADDDAHTGGRITQFAKDVVAEFEFVHGRELTLSMLPKGGNSSRTWRRGFVAGIDEATVMVAMVTPRFLRSVQCREATLTFTAASTARAGRSNLLPVTWVDPKQLAANFHDDVIYSTLPQDDVVDASAARFAAPDSAEYRGLVSAMAAKLADAIQPLSQGHERHTALTPTEGVVDWPQMLASFKEAAAQFISAPTASLKGSMSQFAQHFQTLPDFTHAPPSQVNASLDHFADTGRSKLAALTAATDEFGQAWDELVAVAEPLLGSLDDLDESNAVGLVSLAFGDVEQAVHLAGMNHIADVFRRISSFPNHLESFSIAATKAINLLRFAQTTTTTWSELVADTRPTA